MAFFTAQGCEITYTSVVLMIVIEFIETSVLTGEGEVCIISMLGEGLDEEDKWNRLSAQCDVTLSKLLALHFIKMFFGPSR